MEYTDACLFNKLSDKLKVRQTLDCIAADTNYLNIYSHIYYNTGKKIVMCQLQNAKWNFPKFCKVLAQQKSKTNLVQLYIRLVETVALKIVFKKLLWSKLSILKNTLHALNPVTPGGNKRSHILKNMPTPISCRLV